MGGGETDHRASFAAFVASRESALVRLGWALTGDRDLGEDLAQSSFDRLWKHWGRVSESGEPWAYVQQIAVSIASTWRRRRWHSEVPSQLEPNLPTGRDDFDAADLRAVVSVWLLNLPPRQRTVITLRFMLDLSIEDTARMMRTSSSTVKSQTTKALTSLRVMASLDEQSSQGLHHE